MADMQNLIDMIKRLFTDEREKAEFDRDPDKYLEEHGAGACTAEDVQEAMVLAADELPASQSARISAALNQGGSNINVQQGGATPPPPGPTTTVVSPSETINHYYEYVTTNTTNVDDRDTSVNNEVNQVNVGSDVVNDFDTTIASGDGAAAVGEAGGDVQQVTGDGAAGAQNVAGDVQQATGDDNVQVGGDVEGPLTVGDDNTVVDDSNLQGVAFGDGDGSYSFSDDDVNVDAEDSAVALGGDANDGVVLGEGASIEDSQVAGGDVTDSTNVPIDVEVDQHEETNIDADLGLGRGVRELAPERELRVDDDMPEA